MSLFKAQSLADISYQKWKRHVATYWKYEEKLGAEAFAFVNFARFAVPLRIGLALSTTPWIDNNIVKKYFNKEKDEENGADDADATS